MALGALGVLSTSQIHRRYLDGLSPRGLRHRLQSMAAQGWLRRGHLLCAGPGQTPRIWSLTDSGRGLAEARLGADPFEVVWDDLDQVVHALHVAAWWLAFERVAGRQVSCVRRRSGAHWTRPDLELHMSPPFAIAHVLVAVRPPLPSRTALQQRLDLLLTWGGDAASTAELLVLRDEPTAIAVARAMAGLVDRARVDGTKPAWLGRRVHLTSELDIHHSRLRALTLRSPLPSARTEVALVDLLGRR